MGCHGGSGSPHRPMRYGAQAGIKSVNNDYGLPHASHAAGRSAAHRSKKARALTELCARRRPDRGQRRSRTH